MANPTTPSVSSADEPKPCPMCGKRNVRVRQFNNPQQSWAVECNDVDCLYAGVRVVVQGISREGAIEAWNRRIPEQGGRAIAPNVAETLMAKIEAAVDFYVGGDRNEELLLKAINGVVCELLASRSVVSSEPDRLRTDDDRVDALWNVIADAGDLNERVYGGPNGEWRQLRADRIARATSLIEELLACHADAARGDSPAPEGPRSWTCTCGAVVWRDYEKGEPGISPPVVRDALTDSCAEHGAPVASPDAPAAVASPSEPESAPLSHRAYSPSDRDWAEDFAHENGHYLNTCHDCQQIFAGHKRRVTCKRCAPSPERTTAPSETTKSFWMHLMGCRDCAVRDGEPILCRQGEAMRRRG